MFFLQCSISSNNNLMSCISKQQSGRIDFRKLINIIYYIKENDLPVFRSNEFEAFKVIHDKEYQKNYKLLKEIEFETIVQYVSEDNKNIKNKNVKVLLECNLDLLPIVTINEKIVCKKRILSLEELSELLDIGFSIQEDNL